ncbi:type III secretion system chaperone [Candidatus Sodalis endolongispinus]|uniref:Type III secretion system chaperone n=1 Tax=Candidatus Sodalis endolongispinus TaxID=2812662 RepID=A0ABS5YB80_9GAMM|nr:type III secretion system chaperone [Candidatus Sodalis endolongispinus]MBT9432280.1 type III secretion system chaperone [Candidatus Sodalis endolongispinus]
MSNSVLCLYEASGLDPLDEPALLINEELEIFFDESFDCLEMSCPLMVLPEDSERLQTILSINYASPVTLAADANCFVLLALYRLPAQSSEEEMLAGLSLFVESVEQLRQEHALMPA